MSCILHRVGWTLTCCVAALQATLAHAARPTESLLPNTTKGYVSVGNMDVLEENWNKTQLGQLLNDPVMKPFSDDLYRQLQEKWSKTHHKLGLTWQDMRGVPSGEFSICLIQPSKTEAAVVMLADVTGRLPQANQVLVKVERNMAARQAKRTTQTLRGATLIVYNIPKKGEIPAEVAFYFLKDNILCACDHYKTVDGILGRLQAESKDSLAGLAAFDGIMKRCSKEAGDLVPHARWFVEPFGYTEASRIANPPTKPRRGTDYLKVLKNQGFTAIQGIGGYVNCMAGEYQILHRSTVWAPATGSGGQKYTLAANMLDLPNGGKFLPPTWVPREVAMFTSFNWRMREAFEASKTLVNEVVGDEVFEDVLKSILEDPNGPQTDIRKELVGNLGTHALVMTDYELPMGPKSERLLFAAQSTNPQALAVAIDKSMSSDPDARKREFNGHTIWEIVDEEAALPMVTIESSPGLAPIVIGQVSKKKKKEEEDEEEAKGLPSSAVTVAHGHLLVATHYDFLVKILSQIPQRDELGARPDYNIVHTQLTKLEAPENSVQLFSRTDEVYRSFYELIRQGKMPESETMMGRALNSVLGDGKEDSVRKQEIDGSKLPNFETVRRYFGPAGVTVVTEDNGWFITGFLLTKGE